MITIKADGVPVGLKTFTFSGGERQVRLEGAPEQAADVEITAHLWSSDDIMDLLLAANAVAWAFRRQSFSLRLICPYLPYARQDRVCAPGEANALSVLCRTLNECDFDSIEVWDVHNERAARDGFLTAVEFKNRPAADFVSRIPTITPQSTLIVAPDRGALPRATDCAGAVDCMLTAALKERDPVTGELGVPTVECEHIGDRDFLIVDDICDGGRTFVNLAKVLKPLTTGKIYLYVTHGIFSAGFKPLAKYIDHIYVANLHPHVRLAGMEYLVTHLTEGDAA